MEERISRNALIWSMAVALVLLIVLAAFLPPADAQDDKYCQMVEAWHNDTMTPPEHRAGWPDYRGNYEEVCK